MLLVIKTIDMEIKQATRIQTSILNAAEKKALVYLAERQPKWVTSDMLTFIGFIGALIIAAGFILSNININFLWLSSFGLLVNWYGDSLDGTLARVRNTQRPVYGYYLDHTLDGINESLMFIGAGLSPFMKHPSLALGILVLYLLLTLNVSINAHLRGEFKLTYAKMGPTEFRLIVVIVNTLLIFIKPLANLCLNLRIASLTIEFGVLDIVAIVMILVLLIIYLGNFYFDARYYSKIDPKKDPKID